MLSIPDSEDNSKEVGTDIPERLWLLKLILPSVWPSTLSIFIPLLLGDRERKNPLPVVRVLGFSSIPFVSTVLSRVGEISPKSQVNVCLTPKAKRGELQDSHPERLGVSARKQDCIWFSVGSGAYVCLSDLPLCCFYIVGKKISKNGRIEKVACPFTLAWQIYIFPSSHRHYNCRWTQVVLLVTLPGSRS